MTNSIESNWFNEPRFITKLIGVRVQMLLTLLSFLLIGTYGLGLLIYRPYDGLSINVHFGPRVLYVQPNSPADNAGIKEGDWVRSIDGRGLDYYQQKPLYRAWIRPGDQVVFDIERNGSVLSLTLTIGRYQDYLPWIMPVTMVIILAFVFWFIGLLFIMFSDPGDIRARLLGTGWLSAGIAAAVGGPGIFAHFWYSAAGFEISWIFSGFLVVAAHLYFPKPSYTLSIRKIILSIWGVSALFLIPLVGYERFVLNPRSQSLTLIASGISISTFVFAFFISGIVFSIFLLLRNYLQTKDMEIRRQTGIILWGTGLGFAPFLIFTLLPSTIFGRNVDFPDGSFTILFLALMPLAYLFVFFQRRLLRIDFLINRLVVFFILSLIVLMVSFFILGVIVYIFRLPTVLPLIGSLVTMLVFLPSATMQERVQVFVSRTLYGSYYDHATVTSSFSEKLARAIDRSTLVDLLTNQLPLQMGIRKAELKLLENISGNPNGTRQETMKLSTEEPLLEKLMETQFPFRVQPFSKESELIRQPLWKSFDWSRMISPIFYDDRLLGILFLGERNSGDVYSDRDLRIIAHVTHQAALALTNIQLVENLRGLNRKLVQADEQHRTQIARDLHDSVLQDLFLIKQRLNANLEGQEVSDHLSMIIDRLREVISAQHPNLLKSGLDLALDGLVQDMQKVVGEAGPEIEYCRDTEENLVLSEEVAITVYRIAQEAVANAIKHASSDKIAVILEKISDSTLRVVVQDDGKGMPNSWQESVGSGKHYGLANMKERASMINADLSIVSSTGRGTTVSLELVL